MTNFHEMVFDGGEHHSVFGADPDGNSVHNRFSLPAEDAMSIALERILPGDELVTLDGDCIVVGQIKKATPLGVSDDGHMTWNKQLVITGKTKVTEEAFAQEITRFLTAGAHMKATNFVGDSLVELTYEDGRKAFLVGVLDVWASG